MTVEGIFIANKCVINALQRQILTFVSYISRLIKALSKSRLRHFDFANRVQLQPAFTVHNLRMPLRETHIDIEFPEKFD